MVLQPQWHALFSLDGPHGIPRADQAAAAAPAAQSRHRVTVTLCGVNGGGASFDFASFDMCLGDTVGDTVREEREIHCDLVLPGGGREATRRVKAQVAFAIRGVDRLRDARGAGVGPL